MKRFGQGVGRRGFLGTLAALIATPKVVEALPTQAVEPTPVVPTQGATIFTPHGVYVLVPDGTTTEGIADIMRRSYSPIEPFTSEPLCEWLRRGQ